MEIKLTRKGCVVSLECKGTFPSMDIKTPRGEVVSGPGYYTVICNPPEGLDTLFIGDDVEKYSISQSPAEAREVFNINKRLLQAWDLKRKEEKFLDA